MPASIPSVISSMSSVIFAQAAANQSRENCYELNEKIKQIVKHKMKVERRCWVGVREHYATLLALELIKK